MRKKELRKMGPGEKVGPNGSQPVSHLNRPVRATVDRLQPRSFDALGEGGEKNDPNLGLPFLPQEFK